MKNNSNTSKFFKGFTLIELMIAVAIMALISSIVAVSTAAHRSRSRDARRISEIDTIASAVDQYLQENSVLPQSLDDIKSTFRGNLPTDPKTNASYVYVKSTSGAKVYCVAAVMEKSPVSGTCPLSVGAGNYYIIQGPR